VIEGERRAALGGETFACISPINGQCLGEIARGRQPDIDAAVGSARTAFDDGRWAHKPPAVRKRCCSASPRRSSLRRRNSPCSKHWTWASPSSTRCRWTFLPPLGASQWYAEAIDKVYDEIAPTPRSALALITREPMGVVGVIVPWNYPMIMAAWKLGPALATGNSVVLKPSEKSPSRPCAWPSWLWKPEYRRVCSTWCPATATKQARPWRCTWTSMPSGSPDPRARGGACSITRAASNLKRVYNELGGKSAFVVFDDFADIERAARTVAGSMFFNQGESCNAPSRVLVHERIADRLR
jgi:4-guanidinobutyraldehyde dehydrogenase/NAD-dependent aldehyde dehydrogenase